MLLVSENTAWRDRAFQQLRVCKFWIYILGSRFNRNITLIEIKEKNFLSLCLSLSHCPGRGITLSEFPLEPERKLVNSQDSFIFLEATTEYRTPGHQEINLHFQPSFQKNPPPTSSIKIALKYLFPHFPFIPP